MKARLTPFLVLLEARYAPLLFAVSPQAYAVYLWLMPLPYNVTGEIFAVLGALGFEFIYVGAIAWAEDEKASWWTWGTAAVALIFSVLVAYYVYRAQGAWALLHAGFPVVAFFYTMQLHGMTASAHSKKVSSQENTPTVLPERLTSTEKEKVTSDTALDPKMFLRSLVDEGWTFIGDDEARSLNATAPSNGHNDARYRCPHCQAPLVSKQALGASVKNGHCPQCKQVLKDN